MKKLLFCTQKVNRANIRRENRKGSEHIILTSFTLPPNIVMNGGLYPSEEVDKSFQSLNRTPVTIEHPEIDGVFVSASDPEIDMEFRFGMFNENARKMDDGRVALDKVINVSKLMQSDKGKRLLDRIGEIENNDKARPLSTSVGLFLDVEEIDAPQVNEAGQEYSWIARGMIFDHDAILIDTIAASTPEQGTGIGINKEKLQVSHFVIDEDREVKAINYITNKELSFHEIEQNLWRALNQGKEEDLDWIQAVFDDSFIFETSSGEMFRSNYSVDELGNVAIQDTRLPVERVVEFKPINTTDNNEDDAMRDTIIAELVKLGIKVNADISDADLEAELQKALAANTGGDNVDDENSNDIAELVANAVKAGNKELREEIDFLKSEITANAEQELEELAKMIVNSKKYIDLDADNIKSLGIDTVKKMAANCGVSYGIDSTMHLNNNESSAFVTNIEDLPE